MKIKKITHIIASALMLLSLPFLGACENSAKEIKFTEDMTQEDVISTVKKVKSATIEVYTKGDTENMLYYTQKYTETSGSLIVDVTIDGVNIKDETYFFIENNIFYTLY